MKISPLLRVACALSSPGTELFWNCENPVTMPLTDSLPNGPASKVAGGCHCSGPVRTNVESGVGAVAGAAGAAAGGVAGAACAASGAGVCAPASRTVVMASEAIVCSMRFGLENIGTIPPGKRFWDDKQRTQP